MFSDIVALQEFYSSFLGRRVAQTLCERIAGACPVSRGESVLALGYGLPLLEIAEKASSFYAFMPAEQGVSPVLRFGSNVACLVDCQRLPLADACVDKVILLHSLEGSTDPDGLLREAWRVLKSGGKLLVVVPNRIGFWAYSDRTPFGTGQPYSVAQIKSLLVYQGFKVEVVRSALALPPRWAAMGGRAEKYMGKLLPSFGGALIVSASKNLLAPCSAKRRSRRLVMPLVYASPQPARV